MTESSFVCYEYFSITFINFINQLRSPLEQTHAASRCGQRALRVRDLQEELLAKGLPERAQKAEAFQNEHAKHYSGKLNHRCV